MKKIKSILLVLILVFSLSFTTAFATAEMDYAAIDDGADLFTSEEEKELLEVIQSYSEEYDFDVTLITRDGIGANDILDYADDYEFVDDYSDGLIFLLDINSREYVTSTRNSGEYIFNEAAFDEVDNEVVSYLQDGDYFGAFSKHLDITQAALIAHSEGKEYKTPFNILDAIISVIKEGIITGFLFALIITYFVNKYLVGQMKTAVKNTNANTAILSGSFNLSGSSDRFLYQNISRTPKSTGSSGGSGTRTSSNSRGFSRTSRKGGY